MTIMKLRKRLRKYAFLSALAAAQSLSPAAAFDTHDSTDLCGWYDSDVEETTDAEPEKNFFAVSVADELIIDTCNYDRWLADQLAENVRDSEVLRDAKLPTAPTETRAATVKLNSELNASLAAMIAATTTGRGLPFGHWLEPFAMIGPNGGHSVEQIEAFQAWFVEPENATDVMNVAEASEAAPHPEATEIATVDDYVPFADFDGTIKDDASLVILETTSLPKPKVLDEPEAADSGHGDSPRFVGTSPVIAMIEEPYSSYDLAEEDRADGEGIPAESLVWADALFTPIGQPFCIRIESDRRTPGWSPLALDVADEFELSSDEEVVATEQPTEETDVTAFMLAGSADCLLGEWIWYAGNAVDDALIAGEGLCPHAIGQGVADLVVTGDEFASQVAIHLAAIWPDKKRPAKPIKGAGAKLLARAEAAEQSIKEDPADKPDDQQLAQATATLMQWVDAAQEVMDEVSHRWTGVTEVARNRGTQDDPTRR